MTHYLSFNLPNKIITYCHDSCYYMSLNGLCVVLYVIRVEKSIYSKYMQTLRI